jgi:ABC-type amino acid transport substrate-binding protein
MRLPDGLGEYTVLAEPPPGDAGRGPIMERIRERGSLRIGFDPANLPFSFRNSREELVGLDVELAVRLARGLGVRAEFVPIDWPELPAMLEAGSIDLMPGVWYRPNWFGRLHFSEPYMKVTVGFAVRDERRHEFASIGDLRQSSGLVIGVPLDVRQLSTSLERYLGDADYETRVVEFWPPYFEGRHPDMDAFLMPVEHASGWSLLHPEFTAVVPQPDPVQISVAFGVALDSEALAETVDEWITLARDTGTVDLAYRNWVLGQGAEVAERRWSIKEDVLGW